MKIAFNCALIATLILSGVARAAPEPVGVPSVPSMGPSSAPPKSAPPKTPVTAKSKKRDWLGGRWVYTDRRDDMTDKVIHQAAVMSLETVRFNFPYQNPQHPVLLLHRDGPDADSMWVAIQLDAGQFICDNGYGDSREGCLIVVRFDDDPAERFPASVPATHIRTMLMINNAEGFIVRAQKARKILIQTQVYHEGSQVFKFEPDVLGGVFAP